jgi:hypothetical protein
VTAVLADADPKLKAQLYQEQGNPAARDRNGRIVKLGSRPAFAWGAVCLGVAVLEGGVSRLVLPHV